MANNPESEPVRRVHRAQFSAITREALRDAFDNLVEPDAALSRSVDARQELDLRVGVALTRLLTWRFVGLARHRFDPATRLVSYGPCQTPALSFTVDRATEIKNFVSDDYWKLHVSIKSSDSSKKKKDLKWRVPSGLVRNRQSTEMHLRRNDDLSTDKPVESASYDFATTQKVASLASADDAHVVVTRIEDVPEQIESPVGLNTVGLLKAGSKAMGLSPKQVMSVAEKLYSSGLISYPRTETTKYDPNGFDVRSILRQHTSHPNWGKTASHLLRTKYANTSRPPRKGRDFGDHPPITTLKAATREEVGGGGSAWRVYEFITRHFIGSLGDQLSYTRRVAEFTIEGAEDDDDAVFESEEVIVDSLGFAGACSWVLRDIGAEQPNGKGGEKKHTGLTEGMKVPIAEARCSPCKTQPPNFLQEHELIELMDKNRIGTDASMATHVNNIVSRNYVSLCDETGVPHRPPRKPRPGQKQLPRQIGRYLIPTPLGIGLIDILRNSVVALGEDPESPALLSRPGIRAQMENEVKLIADGVLDKDECLKNNLAWFEKRFQELESSLTKQRVNQVGRSFKPMKDGLRDWQHLNVFEPKVARPPQQNPRGAKGGRPSNSKGPKQKGPKQSKRSKWKQQKGSRSKGTAKKKSGPASKTRPKVVSQ